MKHIITILVCLLSLNATCYAQNGVQKDKMTREEKDEKNQARATRVATKNDYAVFRRQVAVTKEYADEKRKVPKLQADNKNMPVKVVITIDSLDEGDTTRYLTGYIVQNVGDNATLMYEMSFDRTQKKVVSMKCTPEAMDMDQTEKDERAEKAAEKGEKAAPKKAGTMPTVHKKKTGDDDDDDEPEEKPSKKDKDDE